MRSRTPPPLALYPDISENERDLAGARKAARELRKQNKEEAVTEASTRSSTAASSGSVGGGAAGAGEGRAWRRWASSRTRTPTMEETTGEQ